jgi:DNA-binding transcriptional ArsR family regulator
VATRQVTSTIRPAPKCWCASVVAVTHDGDVDVAAAAALIGEPARAALLIALTEAEYLPARELAARAGVAPSTASGHLARLLEGRLVVAQRSGRHRYFRLAGAEVAAAIEALSAIAPSRPVHSLREATVGQALREARTCYDHLAGRLGVELTAALERAGVLLLTKNGEYRLGKDAASYLARELRIDVADLQQGRRAVARPCVDWSERRRHVAGALGAALASSVLERCWVHRRAGNRSLEVTAAGCEALERQFGIVF